MANRYMGNRFPTKKEIEFSTEGMQPINSWAYVKGKLSLAFQDLVKQGHKKYKVTLEALDD